MILLLSSFRPFRYCLIVLLLLPVIALSAADEESLWLTAVEKYNRGDYQAAVVDLRGLINTPYCSYESAARLLLGKCYLHLDNPSAAETAARRLILHFPQSRYAPYAHYLIAQTRFLRRDYYAAARELLIAAQTTRDDDLNLLAREKLIAVFADQLDEENRTRLLNEVKSADIADDLHYVAQGYRPPLKIGVILDLSGSAGGTGRDIAAGIRAAYRQIRAGLPREVLLLEEDTAGSVVRAVQAAEKLIGEENVDALIGGAHGDCAAAVAGVAAANRVPFIVVGAQDRELTQLGDGVFQLLPDYFSEGDIAAWFAWNDLKIQRCAVLAPAGRSGGQRADGFIERFEDLSRRPVELQWYYPGATSFKRQLDNLIRLGADSLAAAWELSEEQVNRLLDWDKEPEEEEETAALPEDSLTVDVVDSLLEAIVSPINFFDALYIPIDGDEISYLAPQIAAAGFDGILIGDTECLTQVTRESDRRYVDGIIFPAHFPAPTLSSADLDFLKSTGQARNDQGNLSVLLGWDAFGFLASVLDEPRKLSPACILDRLEEVRRYRGKRLTLAFPAGSRVNGALYILTFKNGRFKVLKTPEEVAGRVLP